MTYAFADGPSAGEDARRRMAALLFSTSYLEYGSAANKLGLPGLALQRRLNIEPYLPHIRVLQDAAGRFAGFHASGTLASLAAVPAQRAYRDEVQAMDDAYEAFIARHARPEDWFVASLALEPHERGRGLFRQVFDDTLARARGAGSPRALLAVWESNPALALYLRRGLRPVARFDEAWPLFFDHLQLLALPLQESPA